MTEHEHGQTVGPPDDKLVQPVQPPLEEPHPGFLTVTRMNRILMAVMRGDDKETFGLIDAEEDEFWDSMVKDVADAKAGGYSLMLPSD